MKRDDAANALMAQMTLAEKIGQLNLLTAGEGLLTGAAHHSVENTLVGRLDAGEVGAVFGTKSLDSARAIQERALAGSRLEIPVFFAEDVIHGHRTVFPLPIALASSWDMALIEETARFSAAEASAEGLHQVYAPMIDVSRDPRWGRVAESPGEDPWLAARFAEAMVRGLQGEDFAGPARVAACLKHFVAYGATQSGRDYDNASLAWEDLFGVYLPPFAAGVATGAGSVMVAFNAVNKLPMHAHHDLVEGWLRGKMGFDGLVVSDYTGVKELSAHGLGDPPTVVARALHAGIDMDMVGGDYLRELPGLAEQGLHGEENGLSLSPEEVVALIDRACLRVLTFKARLGLLGDPFRGLTGGPSAPPRREGRALARRAAAASAVLLKNQSVLPLKPSGRIALIGPLGDDRANLIGTWSVGGNAADVTTLAEALREFPGVTVSTALGADIAAEDWLVERLNVHGVTLTPSGAPEEALIEKAVQTALEADVVLVAVGEAKEHAGESSSVLAPELSRPQQKLVETLASLGKPLVVVIFAGRPLALGHLADLADSLVYAWHGGIAGAEGIADLLFGAVSFSGRLAATLPAHPGQVPLYSGAETTGRPFLGSFAKFRTGWLDLPDEAQGFPFGFGLSYGAVRYGRPQVSEVSLTGETAAELTVALTNTGARTVTETAQMYLSDPVARIVQPERRLIGAVRVEVPPGETVEARLTVDPRDFAYWLAPSLASAEQVRDPGRFILHVGPNSRDTQAVELTWAPSEAEVSRA